MEFYTCFGFPKAEESQIALQAAREVFQNVCEQLSINSSETENIDELVSYFQVLCVGMKIREPQFCSSKWNKRRSRAAVISVNGWQQNLVDPTESLPKKTIFDKEISIETLSEEFKPVALENFEF